MGEKNFYKIDGRIISTANKDLSPEEKIKEEELVNEFMEYLSESGKESISGELLKTDEERLVIRHFNQYIKEAAADLGLDDLRPALLSKKIHFTATDSYHKKFPELRQATGGHYDLTSDAVYIKKNPEIHRLQLAHVTLHEMIHAFSAIRYDFSSGAIYSDKLGYNSTKISNNSEKLSTDSEDSRDNDELFLGFNEAITDLMAKEILEQHEAELNRDLNIDAAEMAVSPLKYYSYCSLVEWIIDKIAEKNNEDRTIIWKKFKSGMMTGQIMHLREIEKVLGPGALRLVAKIGNSEEDTLAFKDFMKNYDKNK